MSLKAGRRGVRSKHVDIFGNLNESAIDELLEPIEEDIEDLDERLDTAEGEIDALQAATTAVDTPISGLTITGPEGTTPAVAAGYIKSFGNLVVFNIRITNTGGLPVGTYTISGLPLPISGTNSIPVMFSLGTVNGYLSNSDGTITATISNTITSGLVFCHGVYIKR